MPEQKQFPGTQSRPLYTSAGFFMLRAPALPAQTFLQLSTAGQLCLEGRQENLDAALQAAHDNCSRVLQELATQPQIMQAVTVASPSLSGGLERMRRGEGSPKQQKRVLTGLLRYLIRMSTRPTPFGLFSGVASGTFASETGLRLASPALERFRTRPDMSWLLAILHGIEKDHALIEQVEVKLNQTAYLVGERAVLPIADTYGEQDNRNITLRATPVVRKVFELTRQGIIYRKLRMAMHQAFPQASEEQITRLLWQLWEHHFLLSQLHPPLTDAQPARYVRKQLNGLVGVEELKAGLDRVLEGAFQGVLPPDLVVLEWIEIGVLCLCRYGPLC